MKSHQTFFSDHSSMKLNYKKKTGNKNKHMEDELRNQKGSQKIPGEKLKWEHKIFQVQNILRCSKSSFKKKIYSNTGLPQGTQKINNLTLVT